MKIVFEGENGRSPGGLAARNGVRTGIATARLWMSRRYTRRRASARRFLIPFSSLRVRKQVSTCFRMRIRCARPIATGKMRRIEDAAPYHNGLDIRFQLSYFKGLDAMNLNMI